MIEAAEMISIFFFNKKPKECPLIFIFVSRFIFYCFFTFLAFNLPLIIFIAVPGWVPYASFAVLIIFKALSKTLNRIAQKITNKIAGFLVIGVFYFVSVIGVGVFFYFAPSVSFITLAVLPLVFFVIGWHFAFFSDAIIESPPRSSSKIYANNKIISLKIFIGCLFFSLFMLLGFSVPVAFFIPLEIILSVSVIGAFVGIRLFFYGFGEITARDVDLKNKIQQIVTALVFFTFFMVIAYYSPILITFSWQFIMAVSGIVALIASYQLPNTLLFNVKGTKINNFFNLLIFFAGFVGLGFYAPIPQAAHPFVLAASGILALVINGLLSHNNVDSNNDNESIMLKIGVLVIAVFVGSITHLFCTLPVALTAIAGTAIVFTGLILLNSHGKKKEINSSTSVIEIRDFPLQFQNEFVANTDCWTCHFFHNHGGKGFVDRVVEETKELAKTMGCIIE
jgi:hypothetical protein